MGRGSRPRALGQGRSPALLRIPVAVKLGDSEWQRLIGQAGGRYGVDPALIAAVITIESNFDTAAVSHKGALGVMQIMPSTGRELGLENFFDPAANIDAGVRYLAAMLREFDRIDLALAAYNAGPAAVRQHGGRVPPYPETLNYVSQVLATYRDLARQRGK